jgi:thymidylate synthase (FAD)
MFPDSTLPFVAFTAGSLPRRAAKYAENPHSERNGLRADQRAIEAPGAACSIVRPMHETVPQVFLIARPSIDVEGMRAYLEDVGGESWLDLRLGEQEGPSAGELLLEFGGRACYRSWEPGLNPNVSRIRTDRLEYFANILRSGHGSVLEHANYSFALRNVSRVLTHELVRHRAGSAFSQESLRYVRLADIGFRVPPALEPVREQVLSIVEQLEEFQISAAKELGIDEDGVPFHVKKEVTSALRRLAPIGLSTDIVWTANARTLRHVIEMRTAEGAEEELRLLFDKIARIMQAEAPGIFQDFVKQDDGSWVPEHKKV